MYKALHYWLSNSIRRLAAPIGVALLFASLLTSPQVYAQEAAPQESLQPIIVTAEKRTEKVEHIANPITVLSRSALHQLQITRPRELAEQVPGLVAAYGQNGIATINFAIRGVGLNDFTGTTDPAVGVYSDGVYLATPESINGAVFDLNSISVLKGPQGTLYGVNSTGGAIDLVSAPPTEKFGGHVRLGFKKYERGTVEAVLNGPITRHLLGRLSFDGQLSNPNQGYSHNYFYHKTLGRDDRAAVRAQLLWLPRENLNIRLIYTYNVQNSDQALLFPINGLSAAQPVVNGHFNICAPVIAGVRSEGACVNPVGYFDPYANPYNASADVNPKLHFASNLVVLHVNWILPYFTVHSISGYQHLNSNQSQDIDVSPYKIGDNPTIDNKVHAVSEEIRLNSRKFSRVQWLVGASYFYKHINWFQTINLSAIAVPTSNGAREFENNLGIFANITIPLRSLDFISSSFLRRFDIGGGVRYTHEIIGWSGGSFIGTFPNLASAFAQSTLPPLSALPIPPGGTLQGFQPGSPEDFSNHVRSSKVDFRGVIKYHLNDDVMLYATVSEAFRSGGISSAVIFSQQALQPYKPETVTDYEGGAKLTLAQRHIELNLDAFHYKYNNYQATFVRAGQPTAQLQNVGDVSETGVESSLRFLATKYLYGNIGFSWLENSIVSSNEVLPPLNGGPVRSIVGNQLPNAPKFTVNGMVHYGLPFAVFGTFRPYLESDFSFMGKHFLEPNNRKVLEQNAYFLLNARLGLRQSEGPWEFSVWVRNLTDVRYATAAQDLFLSLGFAEEVLGPPRTFGINAEYRF